MLQHRRNTDAHADYRLIGLVAQLAQETGELRDHRLRSHIAATMLTNRLVDLMGGSGLIQLMQAAHREAAEVAKAWLVAYRVADAEPLIERVRHAREGIPAGRQSQWLIGATNALARSTRWLLANADLDRPVDELLDWFVGPVEEIKAALEDLLPEAGQARVRERAALHASHGLDEESSWNLVCLEFLDGLLPVASLAHETKVEATAAGEIYFGLAEDIDFPWLQERLSSLSATSLWDQRAAQAMLIDLEAARRSLVKELISIRRDGSARPAQPMTEFRAGCAAGLRRIQDLLDELKSAEDAGLSSLMVAVRAIADQCEAWKRRA